MLRTIVFVTLCAAAFAGTGTCKSTPGKCTGQCSIDSTITKGSDA